MVQTNLGRNARRVLIGAGVTHVAVGDDDTAATATDVALGSELDREAKEDTLNGATGVVTIRTRFDNVLTGTLTEVGAFDGVAGDLLDRVVHAAVTKAAGTEMLVDITYTIS